MKHNWEYKHWNDVLKIINGKNQKAVENPNGMYPIYGSGGILSYADDYICPENCTIIGRKGNINNPIFVPNKFWNVDTAFGLSPYEQLHPRFLFYFCQIYDFERHNKATTIPSLVKNDLLKIKMPVPPMETQEQIVAELDQINDLIAKNRELLSQLDALAQSLFYDTFGDPISNSKGWSAKAIQSIAKTTAGGTPSKSHPEYYSNGNILWLRSGEVSKMNITDTELRITELGMQNSSAKVVPVNSVVVAMYGATAAQVGIIRTEMALNQAICAIMPNTSTNSIYLYFCLSSLKESLLEAAHGAAQPNISQAIIKTTCIPIPPLALQEDFAVKVEAIEGQKAKVEAEIAELQTLLDARMDYWFN